MFAVINGRIRKMTCCLLMAAAFLLIFLCDALALSINEAVVRSAPLVKNPQAVNGMVRVYLSSLGNPSTLNLTIQGNYSVNGEFLSTGDKLTVQFSASSGSLSLTYNGEKRNMGKSFALRRHSASGSNGILIAQSRESQNPYPGDLSFEVTGSSGNYTLYTVAHIYLENYLYGVLPYEMGNSSNIEALKAQAVAARTYTVRMMQNRASGLYDVKDTTSDQVYRGTPSGNANCVSAVDATKGIVMTHNSSYITTYYSASNGGQTEASRSGSGYPYLKVKDDPFDYANPSSTVKKKTVFADLSHSGNHSQLVSLLKSKVISKLNKTGYEASQSNTTLKTLKSVTPHTPKYAAPSRLYTKMDFTLTATTKNASGQTVTVTQTVTCDIFDELESILSLGIQSSDNELWSVEKAADSFVVQSRRYGHGMGMSQRGAMYMGKLGYTYDQILGFYYDGCTRMQRSFTNTILSADSYNEEIVVEPPAEMEEEDSDRCTGIVRLANAGASLAIRASAASDGRIIGTAGNGAIVNVLRAEESWRLIRFGELCGYVPAVALEISGTPAQTDAEVSRIKGFVKVTASDYVNLRKEPGMNSKVLGTAPTGAVLTVFSTSGEWARVQYQALAAYVNLNYVSSVTDSYPSGGTLSSGYTTARISSEDGSVKLLRSPSTSAEVIARIDSGEIVTVLSDDGSWCRVAWQGETGYVLRENLTDVNQTPEIPPEEIPDEDEPEPDNEPDEDPVLTAIVTTDYGSLNMRAEARAGSRILTTIPRGARVEVENYGSVWSAVRYGGIHGYVMSVFLTLEGENNDDPEPDLSGELTAVVVTPSGSLNLRSEPRTGSTILTRIQPYEQVTVHERSAEWCHVTYRGITGYVMTVFLSFSPDDVPEQEPPILPELPDDDEPDAPIEPDEPDTGTLYAIVDTVSGSLNLRAAALPGSAVIARIPKGTVVVIEQKLAAWSRTTFAGQTGYVSNAFLKFLDQRPPVASGDTAVVSTPSGSLNLRQQPSRHAGVIAQIPRNATVEVQQRGAEWCYVAYRGQVGYVMTVYLHFDSTAPSEPQEPEPDPDQTPDGALPEFSIRTARVSTPSGSLNLRRGPSADEKILAAIPQGTMVEVYSKDDEWCGVSYAGYNGYAMTKFLRFDDAGQSSEEILIPETEEEEPETPVTPPDDGAVGTPAWVVTGSGALNLREAPEKSARVLVTVPRYAKVTVLDEGASWSCITYKGYKGYAMTAYLSIGHEPERTEPQNSSSDGDGGIVSSGPMKLDVTLESPDSALTAVNATSQDIKLWPMCEESGTPLGVIAPDEEVEIILIGETWCLVACGNIQGYCYIHLLSVMQ